MSRLRPSIVGLGLLACLGSKTAQGQANNVPVVSGVFPAGASVGKMVEWSITGRNLSTVKSLLISGGGVEVVSLTVKDETSATASVRVSADARPGFREVRLDGPAGVSNLAIVRVDTLPQVAEVEPNDELGQAQEVAAESAVEGVLRPLDVDHFRIKGAPGQRLTIDLEAGRIGTSITPVVTLFSKSGRSLAQGRESRGVDRDCRMTVVLPDDGTCVVQVRDNTYGGSDLARYRLRIDPTPYATGLFPLGGPRGRAVEVEVSGGNLLEARRKTITLPDLPGAFVDPGEFDGPGGPITVPMRLVVGDGPEIVETGDRPGGAPIDVSSGDTINGRIGKPGEVDVYRLNVKAGEKIHARVEATGMGSWLDSVLVLRDENGATLAENDDTDRAIRPERARSVSALGVPEGSSDSSVEFEAKADGVVTIEVADRFGDGGPEYGYRLAIGPDRPDFTVTLLLGNATANSRAIGNLGQAGTARTSAGQFGVLNLKPGSTTPINFLVAVEGRPGPVEVHVEGLPEGVTAEPVRIRFPGSTTTSRARADPVADFLAFRVASDARPGLGEIRVVGTARPTPGVVLVREASAIVGIDLASVSNRPITRVITRIPLRIVGESVPE